MEERKDQQKPGIKGQYKYVLNETVADAIKDLSTEEAKSKIEYYGHEAGVIVYYEPPQDRPKN